MKKSKIKQIHLIMLVAPRQDSTVNIPVLPHFIFDFSMTKYCIYLLKLRNRVGHKIRSNLVRFVTFLRIGWEEETDI